MWRPEDQDSDVARFILIIGMIGVVVNVILLLLGLLTP